MFQGRARPFGRASSAGPTSLRSSSFRRSAVALAKAERTRSYGCRGGYFVGALGFEDPAKSRRPSWKVMLVALAVVEPLRA